MNSVRKMTTPDIFKRRNKVNKVNDSRDNLRIRDSTLVLAHTLDHNYPGDQ